VGTGPAAGGAPLEVVVHVGAEQVVVGVRRAVDVATAGHGPAGAGAAAVLDLVLGHVRVDGDVDQLHVRVVLVAGAEEVVNVVVHVPILGGATVAGALGDAAADAARAPVAGVVVRLVVDSELDRNVVVLADGFQLPEDGGQAVGASVVAAGCHRAPRRVSAARDEVGAGRMDRPGDAPPGGGRSVHVAAAADGAGQVPAGVEDAVQRHALAHAAGAVDRCVGAGALGVGEARHEPGGEHPLRVGAGHVGAGGQAALGAGPGLGGAGADDAVGEADADVPLPGERGACAVAATADAPLVPEAVEAVVVQLAADIDAA